MTLESPGIIGAAAQEKNEQKDVKSKEEACDMNTRYGTLSS